MKTRVRHVTACPLCGGILQSVTPEALTSAEIIVAASPDAAAVRQCLICGYQEPADTTLEPATR